MSRLTRRAPLCPICGVVTTPITIPSEKGHGAKCPCCGISAFRRTSGIDTRWHWANATTWRLRSDVRRIFRVLVAARQATTAEPRGEARSFVNAQFAAWLNREDIGPWFTWSGSDCEQILAASEPDVAKYSDVLVTGPARSTLHLRAADRSRFPRLTYIARMQRDRFRAFLERRMHAPCRAWLSGLRERLGME